VLLKGSSRDAKNSLLGAEEAETVVLEADTASFLGDKAALIVGLVGQDGRPLAARGWGFTVLDHVGGRSRLLLDADELHLVSHLAGGGAIAVTGSDVPTPTASTLRTTAPGSSVTSRRPTTSRST
jgi:hypothetical protein